MDAEKFYQKATAAAANMPDHRAHWYWSWYQVQTGTAVLGVISDLAPEAYVREQFVGLQTRLAPPPPPLEEFIKSALKPTLSASLIAEAVALLYSLYGESVAPSPATSPAQLAMYQLGYARYAERGLVPAEKRDLSGYASAIDRATTDSDSSVRRQARIGYARALMRTRTDQSADAALREWTWLSDHMYDDDEVRKQLFVYYSVIGNTQMADSIATELTIFSSQR